MTAAPAPAPEYNVIGLDLADRRHFRYAGPPLIDLHCHIMLTHPAQQDGPPKPPFGIGTTEQAERMIQVGEQFGVERWYSMCPHEDIPFLRERFGTRIRFNGSIFKFKVDERDDEVYRRLDAFLAQGIEIIKFWSAPRGRERGLHVDAPWRIEAARRARAAGVRAIMVHVADPDTWFRTVYADAARYGTKPDQYVGLRHMLEEFPDLIWIAAHMGGDPEHPDHLEALLERYPHLHFDTSATKWQVREVSQRPDAIRALICRHPDRFLFGSDLVTRHGLAVEHYVSRYWALRTLWESDWQGRSPIADADYKPGPEEPPTPVLHGIALPADVLAMVYQGNARRLFG